MTTNQPLKETVTAERKQQDGGLNFAFLIVERYEIITLKIYPALFPSLGFSRIIYRHSGFFTECTDHTETKVNDPAFTYSGFE